MTEWQRIETAPKDGTWILGWAARDSLPYRISWGRNHNNELAWCTAYASFVDGYITHWQPLNPPDFDSRIRSALVASPPAPDVAELVRALKPLVDAADGLSKGYDWNSGTHAALHGYRQKLLDALPAARAALAKYRENGNG